MIETFQPSSPPCWTARECLFSALLLVRTQMLLFCVGYLQQEGLSATSRAFILESPNLREYAEHSSDDGVIPACVFVRHFIIS